MAPIFQQRHDYRAEKKIDDNVYVVSRLSDNEQFLGTKWDASTVDPAFTGLLERGTKGALGSLLNHPNLINYTDTVADNVVCGRGTATAVSAQRMLLWDFCEAGTLQNLFRHHQVVPRTASPDSQVVTQYLPEGLCWHVLLSVMSALSWLHEGHRDDSSIEGPNGRRRARDWFSDPDWLPILHRNIQPEYIFFKHPKGTESYGLCKLGNYSACAVSGHVNSNFSGQVISSTRGDERLDTLRENLWEDMSTIEADKRPYTKATELYQLARIVYKMMSTRDVPDPEDDQQPAFNVQAEMDTLTAYSAGLRSMVSFFLGNHRGLCARAEDLTSTLYIQARSLYLQWKRDTPDGKLHRDLLDDGWRRQFNEDERIRADEELLASQGQLSSHRWTMDNLNPQPRQAVPPVPTPPPS
ncbi:hypothetical protein KVR01_005170 [Diaporthe batatas]|uniref:uncharacterized protein n=1 Tax=Diaporthe batatas TaxID=748121 RepID=UPI001D053DCB|nr:uncharacterized protein KVR01_005170 [Diaporthe batatas]KAG8164895.1 hypothetical protein KVR01_005170 [Diaporthe batatas]